MELINFKIVRPGGLFRRRITRWTSIVVPDVERTDPKTVCDCITDAAKGLKLHTYYVQVDIQPINKKEAI